MDQHAIGAKIKYFRKQKGLTQQQLELEIGASPGHVSRIESGQVNPTKETLTKMAHLFNLSPKSLTSLLDTTKLYSIEEVLPVINDIKDYLDGLSSPAYLLDLNWFAWYCNKAMLNQLFKVEPKDYESFIQEHAGKHILEYLFNNKLGFKDLIPKELWQETVVSQFIHFMNFINYPLKKDEPWLKNLITKLKAFPDFDQFFKIAIENTDTPLERKDPIMILKVGDIYTPVHLLNEPVKKYPDFYVTIYTPLDNKTIGKNYE